MATIEIPLSQGKVALIDSEDLSIVQGMSWYAVRKPHTYYANSTVRIPGTSSKYRMHRVILGLTDSLILVDHRDGNGLNNTRENLRIASTLQNCLNQKKAKGVSKFKGVYSDKGRWISRIKANGKRIGLGCFLSEEEAARAYDAAASRYFGEFAKLNFPNTVIGA